MCFNVCDDNDRHNTFFDPDYADFIRQLIMYVYKDGITDMEFIGKRWLPLREFSEFYV